MSCCMPRTSTLLLSTVFLRMRLLVASMISSGMSSRFLTVQSPHLLSSSSRGNDFFLSGNKLEKVSFSKDITLEYDVTCRRGVFQLLQ